MDDLISRAGAIKAICEDGTKLEREGRYILLMASRKQRDADILSALPTVDAVQVRHGRWIYHIDDLFPLESTQECDQCHEEQPLTCGDNFCPNCGADMRGEQDE